MKDATSKKVARRRISIYINNGKVSDTDWNLYIFSTLISSQKENVPNFKPLRLWDCCNWNEAQAQEEEKEIKTIEV